MKSSTKPLTKDWKTTIYSSKTFVSYYEKYRLVLYIERLKIKKVLIKEKVRFKKC